MRRTLGLATAALLALTACGSGDDGSGATPDTADLASSDTTNSDSNPDSAGADSTPSTDAADPLDSAAPDDSDATSGSAPADTVPLPVVEKPEVQIPAEAPTELVRTVLEEGTGDPAEEGDTLIVDYIGVRSSDGVEFDNSYEREPFPITLGAGGVIAGWEEGLVGARQGERVQLDIPSDLAYGDQARGDVIGQNEDLTFVIDVRSVVGQADPDDAPTEPGVPLSEGALDTTFEDLVVGEGDTLALGDTALIRYVNFRGDNGVALETNWSNDPLQIPYDEALLPGLLEGMEGMKVGGRRAITIPPDDGFGPEGNPQGGLPANTDMIFVIELLGVY